MLDQDVSWSLMISDSFYLFIYILKMDIKFEKMAGFVIKLKRNSCREPMQSH